MINESTLLAEEESLYERLMNEGIRPIEQVSKSHRTHTEKARYRYRRLEYDLRRAGEFTEIEEEVPKESGYQLSAYFYLRYVERREGIKKKTRELARVLQKYYDPSTVKTMLIDLGFPIRYNKSDKGDKTGNENERIGAYNTEQPELLQSKDDSKRPRTQINDYDPIDLTPEEIDGLVRSGGYESTAKYFGRFLGERTLSLWIRFNTEFRDALIINYGYTKVSYSSIDAATKTIRISPR